MIRNSYEPPNPSDLPDCHNQLRLTAQYQKILVRILAKIRSSVNIESLCRTSCQDICGQLQIERLAIYRFNSDWSGSFINRFGFAEPPWDKLTAFGQDLVWQDSHLQETQGGRYRKNEPFATADIYDAGHSRCHIEVLEQFQIRAYAIAPIVVGAKLWGLLAAYQHSAPRQWHQNEVEFIAQAASYLGVAMQQEEIIKEAKQRTVELQDAIARQRALMEVVGNIRSSINTEIILNTACQELCKLLKLERAAVYRFNEDWSGEFVSQFGMVETQWHRISPFGKNLVWDDTYLQETKGGRYRHNETFAVNDIYEAGHTRCHIDILEQFKIYAYALAPIFIGKKLWGLIAAYQHTGPREWANYEVEFLGQVGAQLGVAIQQAENLAQSKQQADALQNAIARQRALTEVVGKIRSSLDINLILKTTCQEVCKMLRIERVGVYRFNPDWSGEFVSNFGMVEAQWDSINPFGQNLVWEDTHLQETKGGRYRNNENFAVNDIYQVGHSRCHLDILEQFKIRAYALTPIFVGRNLWGLLAAYQHSAPRQWDIVEVEFLGQVASQLGVALQSSQMMSQIQTRADELQKSAEQRRILFDLVVKIRESLDLEAILKNTVQEVRRSLQADRVGIFRFDSDQGFCSGEFIAEDVLPKFDSALAVKVQDYCFGDHYAPQYRQGQVQVISDVNSVGSKVPHLDVIEQFQVKAQIIVPLMEGDNLWGLLCIHQCTHPRHWEEDELEFVTQIAAQLSVALHQANLFQQSSLLGETRAEANQLAQTLKELRTAQMQIIHAEKMASLGQLVAGVAHEINNPINFIHGNLEHAHQYTQELLRYVKLYQHYHPNAAPEIQEFFQQAEIEFLFEDLPNLFQSMQVGTQRIQEIVTSLRSFSRLDEADFKTANIHECIDSTLMILQHRLKPSADSHAIHVTKDYDDLPLIECYPGQLNQVFMNLLSNAIDALEEREAKLSPEVIAAHPSEIRIYTSLLNQDWMSIRITDNGLGIDEQIIPRLFDPFFTTKMVGKGTGLGLSISYQIVTDKHKGKIYCQSELGKGTEFVVELPILQAKINPSITKV
ncbi:GAF domain-containing protein [Trichormus variabilis ARAD]|nr:MULTISPECIES: GAF domain-containing protein [Nostocaceae]MBC1214647.1 GAF domain-containing protein [Trichormus variabilis ARAD]MBC1255841.1 GAF domain-containing protein [Trichormus variabilis V5]MBC1266755.1 GAF domain-containing protein [Trichormus variabilis FSR]MBC1303407.1 GAF domain-containing protein [Trichormus variabilis N2B]MBC1310601.1 GAF domain-containing protein [Trichormus variabilis PNB]